MRKFGPEEVARPEVRLSGDEVPQIATLAVDEVPQIATLAIFHREDADHDGSKSRNLVQVGFCSCNGIGA